MDDGDVRKGSDAEWSWRSYKTFELIKQVYSYRAWLRREASTVFQSKNLLIHLLNISWRQLLSISISTSLPTISFSTLDAIILIWTPAIASIIISLHSLLRPFNLI